MRVPAHPPHGLDLAAHALGVVRHARGDAAPGDRLDGGGVARRALLREAGDAERAAAEDAAEGEEVGDGRRRRGLALEDEEVLEGRERAGRRGEGGGRAAGGDGDPLAAGGGLGRSFVVVVDVVERGVEGPRSGGQREEEEEASFLFSPGPMPTMEMANRLYSSRELAHFPRSDTLSRPSEAQSTHLSTGKAVSHLKGATVRGGNYSFGKR